MVVHLPLENALGRLAEKLYQFGASLPKILLS